MAGQRGVELMADGLCDRMVSRLYRRGECPRQWREALLAVPRHRFVPDLFWDESPRGYVPLRRDDDVPTWLHLAYAERSLVVQVDDGRPAGLVGRYASSTLPTPYQLGTVLAALDARPGLRVGEIGTGTGYTAAVLARRLGPRAVTTVEVDAELAGQARERLDTAGLGAVAVITGDGADGIPDEGPYDRLVSSATVNQVPPAWLRQVRPGGLILTSWGSSYHASALLRLTVRGDGTATGRLVAEAGGDWLRAQRVVPTLAVAEHEAALARARTTTLDVNDLGASLGVCTAIGLRVPGCASVFLPPDDLWLVDPASGSWARLHTRTGARLNLVNQYGPRDLVEEVERAHRWWRDHHCPPASSWRFTATPDGTFAEPASG